jgi:hypothetical protein
MFRCLHSSCTQKNMNQTATSSSITLRDLAKSLDVPHVAVSLALRTSKDMSVSLRERRQEAALGIWAKWHSPI